VNSGQTLLALSVLDPKLRFILKYFPLVVFKQIQPRMARWLAVMFFILVPTRTLGAENGLTNYLPAYYGDFAVAVSTPPGLVTYNTAYFYSARREGTNIAGSTSLTGLLQINGFQYTLPVKFLGATYAFGAYNALLKAEIDGTVFATPVARPFSAKTRGVGDSSISPLILYWSKANFHMSFYESIIIPTGQYSATRIANTSRNYTSFDSVLSLTWLDTSRGLELSLVPGLMINTKNQKSGYRTGAEFHIDAMLNVFLSENFALGLHGFFYGQIEDDTQSDFRVLGSRSLSSGIGPAVLWVPQIKGFRGKVVGKWLHEFESENRFEGDIWSVTLGIQF